MTLVVRYGLLMEGSRQFRCIAIGFPDGYEMKEVDRCFPLR